MSTYNIFTNSYSCYPNTSALADRVLPPHWLLTGQACEEQRRAREEATEGKELRQDKVLRCA
jgi:hypothetical protein